MKTLKSATHPLTRRGFLKSTALAAGAATFGLPFLARGRNLNSKLNIAAIGASGKGASDTDCCAGENIVALCDVDHDRCAGQRKKYPQAKFYQDFRKMLDEMGKSIDAVTVSTPDHFHAIAAVAAMDLGKHVYCQKPITQTIYEARLLLDLARRRKVVTQMGNQGSAEDGLRRAVECVQAGLIGAVREVHIWTNRPIWPQGLDRPAGSDPVPASMDWNQWIGPAPVRPFKSGVYHPFNWRGWTDFGTGALGDMACHTVNMPFRGLRLGYPSEIEAETSEFNSETYPLRSTIRFQFPAREGSVQRGLAQAGVAQKSTLGEQERGAELLLRGSPTVVSTAQSLMAQPPMTLWWYDGGKPKADEPHRHDNSNKPPAEITADIAAFRGEVPKSGCLLIGDKGKLFSPDDYGTQFFMRLSGESKYTFYKKHPAADAIAEWIPRNPFKGSSDLRHHLEWIAAIKENRPDRCYSRFEVGAQLTEIMLLGCIALRAGKKLEWDGPAMRATNAPEAAHFIRRTNRDGWA